MTDEERREKQRIYFREWRAKNLERARATQARFRKRHLEAERARGRERSRVLWALHKDDPIYREENRRRSSEWYYAHKARAMESERIDRARRRCGLTRELYEQLKPRLNGPCEMCGAMGRMRIDHCHKRRKFRGLLCQHCNTVLGFARDRIEVLQRAIDYLRKHGIEET